MTEAENQGLTGHQALLRCFEFIEDFFQFCDSCLVLRERFVVHSWQEFVPDHVQFGLHVARIGRNCDDRVQLWQNDAELSVLTIAAVGVISTTPKLETISLIPVLSRVAAIRDLLRSCQLNPF